MSSPYGSQAAGYASGVWGTYRQWLAVGAQVRKGERGTTVVLWKQMTSTRDDGDDGDEDPARPRIFARAFTVFNVAQVGGYEPNPVAPLLETERFAHADAFIDALKIPVTFGAYDAHYRIRSRPHLHAALRGLPRGGGILWHADS